MTQLFHIAFLGRSATKVGDEITFNDGLPPPTEQELADSYDAALAEWNRQQNPPKRWPDAEAFTAEFTIEELSAISLSTDPTVAALRFMLSTWRGEVHSDDPRVQMGLSALFVTNLMSEQRLSEIVS